MPTSIGGSDTFDATFNIPSGGDTRNASSVNVALEALANRTKYAKNRLGAYRIVDFDDAISSSGSTTLGSTADATYGTDPIELGSVDVEAGDLVKISVDVQVAIGLTASTGEVKLYTLIGGNAPVDVPGGKNILAESFSTQKEIHLGGTAHAAHTGVMRVFLDMKVAGGQTMVIEEPIACAIEAIRSNS